MYRRLGISLFLVAAGAAQAAPVAPRLEQAETYLSAGNWKASARVVKKLESSLVASDRNAKISAEDVARLSAVKAIGLAGAGDHRAARWFWHVAMNINPGGEMPALDAYPVEVRELLEAEQLRPLIDALDSSQLGKVEAGTTVEQLRALHRRPKMPTEADQLSALATLHGLDGRLTFYADVDVDGHLIRPVLREVDGAPLFAYVGLNLRSMFRFDKATLPSPGRTVFLSFSLLPFERH